MTRTGDAQPASGAGVRPWGAIVVFVIAAAFLSVAAGDPQGDLVPCGGGLQSGGGSDIIDLDAATARVVERGTAVKFRVRFARRPPAPDRAGKPWRVDLLLRDPSLPDYSFGYYHHVNRIVRYDAVASPRVQILLLPEQGLNEYFAVRIESRTLVIRLPGRLLVQDEDLAGVPLHRLRWSAISRDGGICDRIGTGRPTRKITGAVADDLPDPPASAPTTLPAPTPVGRGGLGGWAWATIAVGILVGLASSAMWMTRRRARRRSGPTDRGPAGS